MNKNNARLSGVFRAGTFFLKFQSFPGAVDRTVRYGDSGDFPVVGAGTVTA